MLSEVGHDSFSSDKETALSEDPNHKATQTLGKGLLVILWITAIFMVMIMYDIKSQLEQINSKLSSCNRMCAMSDPANLQIIDAKDGKTPVYLIQRIPVPEDEMMEEGMPAATTQPATAPAPEK
jgi:hypothetical protein